MTHLREWYTHEVARRLGVSKSTILRWLRSGVLPEVRKDGRGWRIWSEDDVSRAERLKESYLRPPADEDMHPAQRANRAAVLSSYRQSRHARLRTN